MSAHIVDPRTVDYLTAWATRSGPRAPVARVADGTEIPPELAHACSGSWLHLQRLTGTDLGRILLEENIRSVRYRYPDFAPDALPRPIDQARVSPYTFRRIAQELRPAWVVRACDCLRYQSCESPDWKETLACSILEGIRESAIIALIADAPWGITDEDLLAA